MFLINVVTAEHITDVVTTVTVINVVTAEHITDVVTAVTVINVVTTEHIADVVTAVTLINVVTAFTLINLVTAEYINAKFWPLHAFSLNCDSWIKLMPKPGSSLCAGKKKLYWYFGSFSNDCKMRFALNSTMCHYYIFWFFLLFVEFYTLPFKFWETPKLEQLVTANSE